MLSETAYIYTLSDPRNNEVRYVGKTFDLRQRFHDHTCNAKKFNKRLSWIKSLKNQGILPKMEILETFENASDEEWAEAERFWISTLKLYGCRLTNMDSGGMGGKRLPQETKNKISQSRKSFRHTPETRAKIAAACKARMTPEEKERLRIKCSKNRHTEETKAKISAMKLGKPRPPHVRAALLAGSLRWKAEHGYLPKPK